MGRPFSLARCTAMLTFATLAAAAQTHGVALLAAMALAPAAAASQNVASMVALATTAAALRPFGARIHGAPLRSATVAGSASPPRSARIPSVLAATTLDLPADAAVRDAAVRDVASMDELDAVVKAAEDGRLVMVEAYGSNCPKCKRMAPEFEAWARSRPDVDAVSVNLSEVSGAYAAFGGPKSVPAFFAYAYGERVDDLGGQQGVGALEAYAADWADACGDEDECDLDASMFS